MTAGKFVESISASNLFQNGSQFSNNPSNRIFRPSRRGFYSAIFRHFKFFSKTLYRQGLHSLINLRYFKVFTGTSSIEGEPVPVYTSKHFTGLLFSKPNALFASKHFLVFFICPLLLKLGMEEKDPSTEVRTKKRKMFSGIWRS